MEQLNTLAHSYGIQTSYYDVKGQLCHASAEALLAILQALGASIQRVEDAENAHRERRQAIWRRRLEPVHIAWDGRDPEIVIRLPANLHDRVLDVCLKLENGQEDTWKAPVSALGQVEHAEVEGIHYTARQLILPGMYPLGYQRVCISLDGEASETLLLSAPERAYEPPLGSGTSTWGVFMPIYALHSERSWGAGDFADLEKLTEWVTGLGGGMVATLPLLAAFLDEPFEPGPYSPASRLFWNEFYLSIDHLPELRLCPAAQAVLVSPEFQKEKAELRSLPLIDYRRQMRLKRRVLQELSRVLFAGPSPRHDALRKYVTEHPGLDDYAKFRAVGERLLLPWHAWPEPMRSGTIREGDYDEAMYRYHLYVQWVAVEQLQSLSVKARARGPGLYLDLPLGVNPDSYDGWREREAFATGITAGAPPDPFFDAGQNWGFAPLHPERIREQGYRYVSAYVRHHLALAGVLRIDHMMGFHRLFWIPKGMSARDGVYVKYPSEELYAVFCLESHRHQAILVGEDLGTVPPEVPPAMARHNVHRMYVMQYSLQPWRDNAINPVFPGCVASMNTHDMPPFAAFWQGLDIQDRVNLGILSPEAAEHEQRSRQAIIEAMIQYLWSQGRLQGAADPQNVLRACMSHMCSGPALVVLATLEDLWDETQPQNVPGTWKERPNWRRRGRLSLETMCQSPQVLATLREMDRVRKK